MAEAKWIWGRTAWARAALGLDPEKVVEVVDWCHAVETVHTIAKQCRWSEARRHRWVHRVEGHLHDGDVDRVLAEIDALAVGRRAKSVLEHRDYFVRNVNAEATLHPRSYRKAGDWDHLANRTLDFAIHWSGHEVTLIPELRRAA